MSYGNTSGRAVVLPRRQERGPIAQQPIQPVAPEQGYETPEYIQMDGMGMHEEYLSLVNQLTDFRAQMKSQGYNPDVRPRDAFGQKMYDQYQLMKNAVDVGTQRLGQGYKNEQAMMEAYYSGDVALDLSRAGGGPYSSQDALNATMRLDFDPVRKYNDVIGSFDPNTTEGAQAIAQYRQGALAEIDQLVSQGFISREAGDLYKSEIGVPATYNTVSDDARRASTAETYQRMRHADEDRQVVLAEAVPVLRFMNDLGSSPQGTPNSIGSDGEPVVAGIFDANGNEVVQQQVYATKEDSDILSGFPLMGKGSYVSMGVKAKNTGELSIIFSPTSGEGTEVTTNISSALSSSGAKVKTSDRGNIEVTFRKDNILPMYRAIMPDKEYLAFRQDLQRTGYLRDGKLTEQDVRRYLRDQGQDPDEILGESTPVGHSSSAPASRSQQSPANSGSQNPNQGRSLNTLRSGGSSSWTQINFNQ